LFKDVLQPLLQYEDSFLLGTFLSGEEAMTLKRKLLTTALTPFVFTLTMGVTGLTLTDSVQANPCAAKKVVSNPCAAKNPCAANPCAANPCAAKNPCAANPCAANPCAAKNPCAANPCAANPCAAKNPCAANPCAANPCAAKNPCAANPCAANPCAAAAPAELTDAQAIEAWDNLVSKMPAIYAKSGLAEAAQFLDWMNVTTQPYQSSTHGERYLMNFANETAKDYAKFEKAGVLPAGSIIAKPTIVGKADGTAEIGPLFMMEKMDKGWNPDSLDWKYSMVMADGSLWGQTKGVNSSGMNFCFECHNAMGSETDGLTFLDEEYRK
jgi:hypothetical protein